MDETYQYDALTRRIVTETAAGTRHYYFNSQWRAIEERVSDAVKAQYVWNPADRWDLIRRKRSTTGTPDEIRFVLRDYLDPAAIINESGTVTERYRYDAFGPVTVLAPGFSVRTTSECGWNFLYHAEFIDTLTGLYNYGYRYYHPDLGRWTSRDPIEEHSFFTFYTAAMTARDKSRLSKSLLLSGYQFCDNSPSDSVDVHGLMSPAAAVAAIALVCLEPFFLAGQHYYPDDEKMRHCWTSCSAGRTCSVGLTALAGLGFEALTATLQEVLGEGVDAKEKANMVRDILNNISGLKCAGVSGLLGPMSGLTRLFQESCDCCCKKAPAAP